MRAVFWGCAALAVLTLAAYWPVFSADFVNFDDPVYVTKNPHVLTGLTWANWGWAWTSLEAANWHPITWLSLQLDAQLYGQRAAGYHATNLILHLVNSLLLFGWLRQLTRSPEFAFTVAALFAVHPLHVESVAWIAERKDVLSSLFGIAALWAYTSYARAPRIRAYLFACGLFALSLMAKPMWVTLPMQLLLLDLWPLERMSAGSEGISGSKADWRRLLLEKIPFLILSVISCLITLRAQQVALKSLEIMPFWTRVGTAVVAYVIYLQKTIWPTRLALFYPYPNPPYDSVILSESIVLLVVITLFGIIRFRRCPAILMGWLWYLGTLVPVIGIVQVGDQAYADRYAYLPHIGLLIALIWELRQFSDRSDSWVTARRVVIGFAVVGYALLTRMQVAYWQNSESIWRHTLAVTENNAMAHNNLGTVLSTKGQLKEAIVELEQAAELKPDFAEIRFNLGNALKDAGQIDLAEPQLRAALQLDPEHALAHQALGVILAVKGQTSEAVEHLSHAAKLRASDPSAWLNLATAQASQESFSAAASSFARAAELQPERVQTWIMLASAEYESGQRDEARKHYARSLELDPRWPVAMNVAAWNLATAAQPSARSGARAIQLARRICQATNNNRPEFLETLAAAYAEADRFDDAIAAQRHAIKLYAEYQQPGAPDPAAARLKLYQGHQAYRQIP